MPSPSLDLAADRLALWRRRPDAMVCDLWPSMAGKLDGWQVEALRYAGSPGRNKRLALSASAGVGKSSTLGWIGWNRLLCYGRAGVPGGHPRGAAVSMDGANLQAGLVAEMSSQLRSSPLLMELFEMTATRIFLKAHPRTWFLDFRTWPRKADKEEQGRTLSGLHSLFPFALLDESATIPIPVGRTAEQIETHCEDSFIGQAGNPTAKDGCLYAAAVRNAASWHVLFITADPDDPKRCQRIPAEVVRQKIDEAPLGRDDPWIQSMWLGRFPDAAINQLLTEEDVLAAMERSRMPHEYEWAPKIIGIDAGGGGLDPSVGYVRQHTKVWPRLFSQRSLTGVDGASLVGREWNARGVSACFIDDTGGFGRTWIEQLRVLRFAPVGIHFSGTPTDPGFRNKRAEMWWKMAEAVKAGCALPKQNRELIGDLSTPTYTIVNDKLQLEDKARVKARLGRSPDDGDALALTWAQPVAATRSRLMDALSSRRARFTTFDDHGWKGR